MKLRTLQDTIEEFQWFLNTMMTLDFNHEMKQYIGALKEKVEEFGKAAELELTYRETERPRMTNAQRDTLWELCGRYNVPFREDDYHPSLLGGVGGKVMYEGWIGGSLYAPGGDPDCGTTIYVGVEPNGDSHS